MARVAITVFALALALWALLRGMQWLARRNWIYAGTIARFEAEPVPKGALLFLGSSSIRLWSSLAADFEPWPVVNRGFGGAVVSRDPPLRRAPGAG